MKQLFFLNSKYLNINKCFLDLFFSFFYSAFYHFFYLSISQIQFMQYLLMSSNYLSGLCLILILSASFAIVHSDEIDTTYDYERYCISFNRTYSGDEKEHHRLMFNQNYAEILELRKQGHDLAPSNFTDWNSTQKQEYFNYHPEQSNITLLSPALTFGGLTLSPSSYDWRSLARVTPVKNQGGCGSCWAFNSIAQFESALAIATNGIFYDLAEQYPLQCENISLGCSGGYPYYALKLLNSTGVPLQSSYPYKANDQYYTNLNVPICTSNNKIILNKTVSSINHYSSVTAEQLQQYLVTYGPIAVGVNGSSAYFQSVSSSGSINCVGVTGIDHAVLLVGYNETHWFIKNSWGTNWGSSGFGYINKLNDCGVTKYVDVMSIDYSSNPLPPTPPPPIPPNYVNLTITLTDSAANGWGGTILSLRQNGVNSVLFGSNFIGGSTLAPFNVSIDGNLFTQIAVHTLKTNTQQIGFEIKSANGTVVYSRTPGVAFTSTTLFSRFCLSGSCSTPNITFTINMTDSGNNGWGGIILGFKQVGLIVGMFGDDFTSGSSLGPKNITLMGEVATEIFVLNYASGLYTNEVGFTITCPNGTVLLSRTPGTNFTSTTNFKSFCPLGFCNNPAANLVVTLTDTAGNGWGGNTIGLSQNGQFVGEFGATFTNGSSFSAVVPILGNVYTQLKVKTFKTTSQQIGFQVRFDNGTLIYARSPGTAYISTTLFTSFCPFGGCPTPLTTVTITMTDTAGDGWNGNIFGFKQDNIIVAQFGAGFTQGSTYGPISLMINGYIQTQIVSFQYGFKTQEIGFVVKNINGTTIFTKLASSFSSNAIFRVFCPLTNCPYELYNKYYVTLQGSCNGWNGNVLAIRQFGSIVANLTMTSGTEVGPIEIQLQKFLKVEIIVLVLGTKSWEVGYQIRTITGFVISQRTFGASFAANAILGSFTPDLVNQSPVQPARPSEPSAEKIETETVKYESDRQKSLIVGISIVSAIAGIFAVLLVFAGLQISKLKKTQQFLGHERIEIDTANSIQKEVEMRESKEK